MAVEEICFSTVWQERTLAESPDRILDNMNLSLLPPLTSNYVVQPDLDDYRSVSKRARFVCRSVHPKTLQIEVRVPQ